MGARDQSRVLAKRRQWLLRFGRVCPTPMSVSTTPLSHILLLLPLVSEPCPLPLFLSRGDCRLGVLSRLDAVGPRGPRTVRSAWGRQCEGLRRVGGGLSSRSHTHTGDRRQQSAPTTGHQTGACSSFRLSPTAPDGGHFLRVPTFSLSWARPQRADRLVWRYTGRGCTGPPLSAQHGASLVALVIPCCSTAPITKE